MGYTELHAAARALGLPLPGAQLSFAYQGIGMTASLKISSGSVCGVTLEAESPAPLPEVELAFETAGDRRGKRLGIARELQTGDPEFDDKVYIDTDEPDAKILRALAPPQVRAAVLELLGLFGSLQIVRRGVVLESSEHAKLLQPDTFKRLVGTVHALVSGMATARDERAGAAYRDAPPVDFGPSPARPFLSTRIHRVLFLSCGLSLLGAFLPLTMLGYGDWWRPIARGGMILLGFGGGALVGALLVPVLALTLRGRSSSYRRFVFLGAVSVLACTVVGPVALLAANALADRSPASEHVVPIDSVEIESGDDGDQTSVHYSAAWRPSHDALSFDLDGAHPELKAGTRWHVVTRSGALGWEWIESCSYEVPAAR